MEYRKIGGSELTVSAVGVGCNNFVHRVNLEEAGALVHKAIDLGITLFDTADVYGGRGGSEDFLGRILGDRRKDVVLATKFGQPMDDSGELKGSSRRYIMTAVEASLRRLRTDWIDLYQLHWPNAVTPVEETLRALDELVRQGKVRHIGASNFDAAQVREADRIARDANLGHFISYQSEYSLLARGVEAELLPAIEECDAGFIPYFPLASGLLTGKYKPGAIPPDSRLATPRRHEERFIADAKWQVVERLKEFCSARGRTLLELSFSWLLTRPVVASVIAGATRPAQLEQNVAAANWQLSAEDLSEVDRITRLADSGA